MTAFVSTQRNLIDIANLNRIAVHKLRNGSPKFRDVLRKRCRERMKGNRCRLFDKLRNLSGAADVDEIINALDSEANSFDEQYDIPITEEEENIIAEYEVMLMNEEALIAEVVEKSMENEVICPFCQKCALKMEAEGSYITCSGCSAKLATSLSMNDIGQRLQNCVDRHGNGCYGNPQFHVLAEDMQTQICMTCQACAYMDIVL